MIYKYYLNLTTGIEALFDLPIPKSELSFTRIQSTHCERLLLEEILLSLDSNLLMNLALGNICIIVDYGAKSHTTKSIRIGLEWIRFYLNKIWLSKEYTPVINQKNVLELFEDHSKKISRKTKQKILFFKKFLFANKINLIGLSKSTQNDSNTEFYNGIIKSFYFG